MNTGDTESKRLTMAEKLALAQEAFQRYKGRCFWFIRDDFQVTEDTLDLVIKGLRSDGDRQAFFIAAKLCQ
jgi:hypothetical protein